MIDLEKFAQRVKELRKLSGLTQQQVSQATSIKQTTISCWEMGKYPPTTELLVLYAEYFDVSVDYLLGRADI